MTARMNSFLIVFSVAILVCGCADQKKPPQPVVPQSGVTSKVQEMSAESVPVTLTPTAETSPEPVKITQPEVAGATEDNPVITEANAALPQAVAQGDSPPATPVRPFTEGAYLPQDTVGLLVLHPKRFLETPFGKVCAEVGLDEDAELTRGFFQKLNVKFAELDRVSLVVDQGVVNSFARKNQLPVVEGGNPAEALGKNELKNALKQLGLSFHMYHDTFSCFPRADGDGQAKWTGLSWRVHLLPFLDQQELFSEFHLDEPWDSDHNKSLIPRMPRVFASPEVSEEGKSAFHVFSGKGTMFDGDRGIKFRQITDGTSNTLLAVLAAPDAADVWTKPGGLQVDLESPRKSLGDLKGEPFLALFADGFVRELPGDINEELLAKLIQPADGQAIQLGDNQPGAAQATTYDGPLVIVALDRDIDAKDVSAMLLGEFSEEIHEGQAFSQNSATAVWGPDKRTIIFGAIKSVKNAITAKQSGKASDLPLVSELKLEDEFSGAFDLESQAALVTHVTSQNPMLGMVTNIKTAAARFSLSAKAGDPLIEFIVTAFSEDLANGLAAVGTAGLGQAQMTIAQVPEQPNANATEKELQSVMKGMIADAKVSQDGDKVRLNFPTPKGFDRIVALLKPALISARTAAQETRLKNSLRMVGLAFHNYHDAYAAFPGAGRGRADGPAGLSWRVHLLPYLDQAGLYNQFKKDEPWDSEHNKALIDKMPALFKSPGVEEEGKTSMHVFTGPGSLFADDAVTGIVQITDGTSNTILTVLAGPETAEIWTKPGGLDFDPNDPIQALGNLTGETFIALFADGSVRNIAKVVDAATLRRLIQMKDGEIP